MQNDKIFRYVPHHQLEEYEGKGWIIHDSFVNCRHGEYATLCEWPEEDLNNLIQLRQPAHGPFTDTSTIIQDLKDVYRATAGWDNLCPRRREALDCIAIKIGRILSGNASEPDHWNDIAGYAELGREGVR